MQYMLIFRETPAEVGRRDDPAAAPAYWGAWNAYIGALGGACVVLCVVALAASWVPSRRAAMLPAAHVLCED